MLGDVIVFPPHLKLFRLIKVDHLSCFPEISVIPTRVWLAPLGVEAISV
jgi:hypothetical protein